MDNPVQTRSEQTGLKFWPTIKQAKTAANKDKTIWKISYTSSGGNRIRLVRQPDYSWKHESLMDEVNKLLSEGME